MAQNINQDRPFRLVVPKKGRLREDFDRVMNPAGLVLEKDDPRQDFGIMRDSRGAMAAVETLIQRPKDALDSLVAGIADLAVVGRDTLLEFQAATFQTDMGANLRVAATLNDVSRCAICIAAPEGDGITQAGDLQGLRIATSYPALLRGWLAAQGVAGVAIIERQGGVEDTIRLGLADAICDVVQSGQSLRANGLAVKFRLMESCAVVVSRDDVPRAPETALLNRLSATKPARMV